ncbi:MAG: NUDIX hydrolase [Candidatus Bathyarchaeia archaeon]
MIKTALKNSLDMNTLKREYPECPVVGVGAVAVCEGKILLVKRGSEPGKHKWSIAGGLVELGEKIQDTVIREVKEESNLDVEAHSLIDVVDNLELDENGGLRYHFVILDFFVRLKAGLLRAGSDVLEVRWVPLDEVEKYDLTGTFRDFFERNRKTLKRFNSRL